VTAGDWETREFAAGAAAARERRAASTLSLLLLLALALAGAAVGWASVATIEEVARATGRVIPSGDAQVIQSLEGGVVESIDVAEGDRVVAGDVLLRIDDTRADANRGELLARRRVLSLRAARLRAEAAGADAIDFPAALAAAMPEAATRERVLFEGRRESLARQIEILEESRLQKAQEVEELLAGADGIVRSIALLDEEIALQTRSGVVPRARIIPLERERNERTRELDAIRSDAQQTRGEERAARARIDEARLNFAAEAREALAEALGELSVLEETLRSAQDVVRRSALRAPVDGVVTALAVNTIGGVIRPGEEVLRILPSDAALQVEARVRPEDIAFVRPGLEASVKLTAYDFTIYGALDGVVARVAADAEVDERTDESFFPVIVETTGALIHAGRALDVRPGMVAQVDVLTGERTVLDYLLKPFRKARYEALRER
jgi:adhesin transport system membrane fusion protein